jgi:Flp pilus assembly protein TadD
MKHTSCAALLLVVAACSPEAPRPVVKAGPVLPSPQEMLAQVRAAGAADPDSLEVQPLRDPQVGDLRMRAITLESHSDYAGAAQAVTQALAITPNDPELLQQSAEFALYQQDWVHAEGFAQQSYDRGPKVGSLCRRNWTTLRFVRLAHDDVTGVQVATVQLATCTLAPPVRM